MCEPVGAVYSTSVTQYCQNTLGGPYDILIPGSLICESQTDSDTIKYHSDGKTGITPACLATLSSGAS